MGASIGVLGNQITEEMKEIYRITGCSYAEIDKALKHCDGNLEETKNYLKERYHVTAKPYVPSK